MKRALITGITGQDGSYLAELLLSKGYAVHGIVRPNSDLAGSFIEYLTNGQNIPKGSFCVHRADLHDRGALETIFGTLKPDEVYHLAGQSHLGQSFEQPAATCEQIAVAMLRLLEVTRLKCRSARFFHASSAAVFGTPTIWPQDENTPFAPISPYGCAKAFATQLGQLYRRAYDMFVCNGILFNHESPRRGVDFVTRKIARAVARISGGLDDQLVLGNTRSERDWGRAQDYVEAMWLMLQHHTPDDYVVATGASHSVQEFVELAFTAVDLPWHKYLKHDPVFDRPIEATRLVGRSDKIRNTLGWRPTGSFSDLVREMVQAELAALQS